MRTSSRERLIGNKEAGGDGYGEEEEDKKVEPEWRREARRIRAA